MSIELDSRNTAADTYEQYRALSTAAVASLIVGMLSVLAILDWTLVAIPVVGVTLATFAWLKVKRHADELTGAGLARAGLMLSALFLVVGPTRLTYVYLTEVPDGYARTSYAELQPDPRQPTQLVPPSALALEGKKIFIKGFVYPGRQTDGIREFLLVRDRGDCCFGGDPKITDRILVKLDPPLKLSYSPRLHKLAGTFHVEVQNKAIDGARGGVYYHLQADHLE
ncbi:MAG: hypothetical protein WD845_01650 [Pirellulales bacterium]